MNTHQPEVSFEFFPPKTVDMENNLWDSICALSPLAPSFLSVTYGAGGSTRERTHNTVARIISEAQLPVAAHLTCIDASRHEIDNIARRYWDIGVRHIVALRGDLPNTTANHVPSTEGYSYAADLVTGLRSVADFDISVAAYPEVHPEALNAASDLENLKRKIDSGASQAITQFFFENDTFLRFRDRVVAAGIDVPLIPGIMPVSNFKSMLRFAKLCGTRVPISMHNTFSKLDDSPYMQRQVAIDLATQQCDELLAEGTNTFHFYTLNRSALIRAVCENIGVKPNIIKLSSKEIHNDTL